MSPGNDALTNWFILLFYGGGVLAILLVIALLIWKSARGK